jgi:non-heme chloroperoxidase
MIPPKSNSFMKVTPVTLLSMPVDVNGASLSVLQCGQGQPVILIHGMLADYRSWRMQTGVFAKDYHTVAYSRRGHYPRNSSEVTNAYRAIDHVNDLFALIDALGVAPVHVIGRGYGAAIGILAAAKNPALFRSLTLGEPLLFSLLNDLNDRVAFRLKRIALDVVRKLAETDELDQAVLEYLRITYGRDMLGLMSLEVKSMIRDNAHTLGPALATVLDTMEFDHDSAQRVRIPVLIIQGERSPRLNRAICKELHRVLPDSRLTTLKGSSHGLHLEQPTAFNHLVREFLASVSAKIISDPLTAPTSV